jgi:hypothetical protein
MPQRVPSRHQARELCKDLDDAIKEADLAKDEAWAALQEARDAREDACEGDGFWSLSTLGDIVGGAAIVGGCLSNPFGWVACGSGVVAGGGTIIISESQRDSGDGPLCERAEDVVARAEESYERLNDLAMDLRLRYNDCFRHHYAWWQDPDFG